jgi:hypothetical protein
MQQYLSSMGTRHMTYWPSSVLLSSCAEPLCSFSTILARVLAQACIILLVSCCVFNVAACWRNCAKAVCSHGGTVLYPCSTLPGTHGYVYLWTWTCMNTTLHDPSCPFSYAALPIGFRVSCVACLFHLTTRRIWGGWEGNVERDALRIVSLA